MEIKVKHVMRRVDTAKNTIIGKMKRVGNAAYFNISDYSSIREDGMNPSHYLNKKTELHHCIAINLTQRCSKIFIVAYH